MILSGPGSILMEESGPPGCFSGAKDQVFAVFFLLLWPLLDCAGQVVSDTNGVLLAQVGVVVRKELI